jgi:hypothetical protein
LFRDPIEFVAKSLPFFATFLKSDKKPRSGNS